MISAKSIVYPSFPRKREPRGRKVRTVTLDPRFRGGDDNYCKDGKSDILWQNSSGAVAIWEMNGTSAIAAAVIANRGPTWHA